MADPDAHILNAVDEPHAKLVELSELLVGTWRVDGPDISGQAEYQAKNGGRLLVAYVDFRVGDSRMRVIQHITYDEERGTLVARYMDTMGDEATYTWVLEDQKIRVSLGEEGSNTYFRATLNEDNLSVRRHLALSRRWCARDRAHRLHTGGWQRLRASSR